MLKKLLLLLLTLTILAVAFEFATNPLRRSEEHIEEELLAATPMGTSMEDVETYIRDQGWEIFIISHNTGFYDTRVRPTVVTGSKYIRASLGDYQDIPFEANVTVFWAFNEQSELIEIWVWKTWNAL